MQQTISCPHCKAFLSFNPKLVGRSTNCPKCQTNFVVTESATAALDPEATVLAVANSVAIGRSTTVTFTSGSANAAPPVSHLGKYEIRGTLGKGGFGLVYQAFDPQLERLLALKVPTFGPEDIDQVKRFRDEAKAAAQLRHPNIVPVYESGKIDDRYYIASQFIDGKPLSSVVKAGPVGLYDAATWCAKIAEALAYAHEMKIVHRDVKPQNIMLDGRDEPQLMDFGLAKRIDDAAGMTGDGTILGTPAYMAPEQARGDIKRIGAHTDQYSLGVTLYELLTGRRPFVGEPLIVLHQIVHDEPPPPSVVNPKIPRDLEAITQKAMSKEISSRYTNCEDFANDLWRWLVGEPTLARPISTWERLARWARRNRSLATAFAATAAALLLVAVLGFAMAAQQSLAKRQIEGEQAKTKTALDDVTKERDRAGEQTKIAEDRRQLAATRLEEAEANAYVARIRLAAAKWDAGDISAMNSALDDARPKPGEKERRGWEWNYLWNQSHSHVATFSIEAPHDNHRVNSYSPDGLTLLCTGGVPTIRDAWSGDIKLRLAEVERSDSGCFSPDGQRIYTATQQVAINCWDVKTGAKRYTLTGTPDAQIGSRLVVSNNGEIIANDGPGLTNRVTIWAAESGNYIATLITGEELNDHTVVRDFGLSPDGRFAAICTMNKLQIYNVRTGESVREISCREYYTNLCYSQDGQFITLRSSQEIGIYNAETGEKAVSIPGDESPRTSLQMRYSRDGVKLAGFVGDSIRVWNSADGKELLTLKGHINAIDVVFSPDGRWLASGSPDGTMKVWDARTGTTDLDLLPLPDAFELPDGKNLSRSSFGNPSFSADGKKVLACGPDAAVWDVESGEPEEHIRFPSAKDRPFTLVSSFSADQQLVFGMEWLWWGGEWADWNENSIRAWNRFTGDHVLTIKGKEARGARAPGRLFFAATSSDGRRTATRSLDEPEIQIWDMATGQQVQLLKGHSKRVTSVAYSADGMKLVSAGLDGKVIVWDAEKGVPLHSLKFPEVDNSTSGIYSVGFSHLGDQVLAATNSTSHQLRSTLRRWNSETGAELPSLRGNTGQIDSAAFSPDGRRIMTSALGDMQIWDIDTGLELLAVRRNHKIDKFSASMACMSQDGTRIVSGRTSAFFVGEMNLWDGRPETEWKTRAAERAARSTVAYFREKTKSQDELVAAIKAAPTISEEIRALAVKFASQPPVRIVELHTSYLCIRKAFAAHRSNDPQQLTATLVEAKRDFPDDALLHRKIAHLLKLLNPSPLVKLSELPSSVKSVPLAEVHLEEMSVGWAQPMRNRSDFTSDNNVLLEVNHTFFESGLWAHAPARHVVRLDGGWKEFTTQFGIRDESIYGSVVFVVRGDGKELFRSETMTPGKIGELKVSVADCTELELLVEELGNTNSDWSLWLNPQLSR